jgi:hypothetical protein
MATAIDMASNALLLLGDNPISTLDGTEPGSGSLVAANLYEETYKSILSSYPWSFALKEQYLNRLSQTPDDETYYSYAFQIPSDTIRIWKVMSYNFYSIVGPYIYSNERTLLCRYIYRVNEAALPAHVVKAVEYKLAADFAVPVTEDQNKAQFYEQKYMLQVAQAQGIDSQNQPMKTIIDQPLNNVRYSGSTYAYTRG